MFHARPVHEKGYFQSRSENNLSFCREFFPVPRPRAKGLAPRARGYSDHRPKWRTNCYQWRRLFGGLNTVSKHRVSNAQGDSCQLCHLCHTSGVHLQDNCVLGTALSLVFHWVLGTKDWTSSDWWIRVQFWVSVSFQLLCRLNYYMATTSRETLRGKYCR